MRTMLRIIAVLALAVGALTGQAAWAADATLREVYQAAQSGRLKEAEGMMDQVLRDHPGSAKAHFVDAEILAREGKTREARAELATAEHLQPGLAFARPQPSKPLRARLRGGSGPAAASAQPGASPLSWLLWGGVALIFIVLAARWMQNRSRQGAYVNGPNGPMPQRLDPSAMAPAGYGAYPGAAPMGGAGGGIGSGILGGLATGAAVGAGVVAGEALMHRVLGGNERENREPSGGFEPEPAPYDMGGSDFGVSGGWTMAAARTSAAWAATTGVDRCGQRSALTQGPRVESADARRLGLPREERTATWLRRSRSCSSVPATSVALRPRKACWRLWPETPAGGRMGFGGDLRLPRR